MRPDISKCYKDSMIRFLCTTRNIPVEQASLFVDRIVKTKAQDKPLELQAKMSNGDFEIKETTLLNFLRRVKTDILTPSGSAYIRPDKQESVSRKFVLSLMEKRDYHKKRQFKFKAEDKELASTVEYIFQTLMKISCNSLPGGMGSPYNIFYDRGGYNAITSMARSLIATSYTIAEQFLEGNFAWFSTEDAINYIVINSKVCPPKETIVSVMEEYSLTPITNDGLFVYVSGVLKRYGVHVSKMQPVADFINNLEPHVCSYLYYVGNFKHLIRDHKNMSKPLIDDIFDFSDISTEGINPNDLFKLDNDIATIGTLKMAKELNGKQPYSLPKDDPELAKLFIAGVNHIETKLKRFDRLWATFITTPTAIPKCNSKKHMFRSTVTLSDTDSVVFTASHWVDWYTGNTFLSDEAFSISSLAIYWLIKAVTEELAKWSTNIGSTKADIGRMVMKNEFLFPAMLLFDIKKTYAALTAVQEGMVLPELTADIKGVQLRGSNICKPALKFTKDFIVESILKTCLTKDISARELLGEISAFEIKIRTSLKNGELEFLPFTSFNTKDHYKNPLSAGNYIHWLTWKELFGEDCGYLMPPLKAPDVPFVKPPVEYFDWLRKHHPKIAPRLTKLVETLGKFPSGIAISEMHGKIPEAIRPIVDVRKLIYSSVKPVYRTMLNLGLPIMYSDNMVLVSDIYQPTQ